MKFYKIKKRHSILLEVVIALTLVALCVLPLLVPHVYLLKQQQRFLDEVNLDRFVNLLYSDMLVQLYKNEIPWRQLQQNIQGKENEIFDVTPEMIARTGYSKPVPKGTYRFEEIRKKPNNESPYKLYLYKLIFQFETPRKPLTYEYQFFLLRYLDSENTELNESDEEEMEEASKEEENAA